MLTEGHALEVDLKIVEPDKGLRPFLDQGLPAERVDQWQFWLREVVADAFGGLLGGAGFAYVLMDLMILHVLETALQQGIGTPLNAAENTSDRHPPYYVRVPLLVALLRATGTAALDMVATEVEQAWQALSASGQRLRLGDLSAQWQDRGSARDQPLQRTACAGRGRAGSACRGRAESRRCRIRAGLPSYS